MRYKMNQSLLYSWLWMFKKEEGGYEDFLRTLNREKTPPTEAMLDGVNFENLVNAGLDGNPVDPSHKWAKAVTELTEYLDGAQKQVSLYKDVTIDGTNYLMHGILDFLRNGVIYDTKFSKNYHLNKYLDSPQWPMYFALVPEAKRFEFLSSDGTWICKEIYYPEQATPIESTIHHFARWLKRNGLWETYTELWKADGD